MKILLITSLIFLSIIAKATPKSKPSWIEVCQKSCELQSQNCRGDCKIKNKKKTTKTKQQQICLQGCVSEKEFCLDQCRHENRNL